MTKQSKKLAVETVVETTTDITINSGMTESELQLGRTYNKDTAAAAGGLAAWATSLLERFDSTVLWSPTKSPLKSTATEEQYTQIKRDVEDSFTEEVTALLRMDKADAKGLEATNLPNKKGSKVGDRRYWDQQVTSRIRVLRLEMEKQEEQAEIDRLDLEYAKLCAVALLADEPKPERILPAAKPKKLISVRLEECICDAFKYLRAHDGKPEDDIQHKDEMLSALQACSDAVKKYTATKPNAE